jgi:SSS family solute:Na+ symporter
MTDLFQGVMLLATGLILLYLGIDYLGGAEPFWEHLPRGHRQAFSDFNGDPKFPAVGIFWQDAMANSAMFYFLNQGMVMRLLSARSVKDSRRAVVAMMLILMPIAAIVVASGGWVAAALTHAGVLPADIAPKEAFFIAADFLTQPGVFGLIMAALTAALMSTVDTLITAIAAIVVNDVYSPRYPQATDAQKLRMARISSVSITVFGVLLVPVFASFGSIYAAHGAFTAAITPPLVVALLFGVFWKRFTSVAAFWTMVGGSALIFASVIFPELITPFAHGVPMTEVGDGLLAGKDQ